MATLKDVVVETGQILIDHPLWSELRELWHTIQWQQAPNDSGDGVALSPAAEPIVRLHPNLLQNPNAGKAVLREFGKFILRRGGDRAETIWDKKLGVPDEEHIDEFAKKLSDPELRKTCKTYEELLQSYPQRGHSVERLIAIHMANALIANNIPYPDSVGVNIKTWGPTAEFANHKKYHSLVPLTSAYCPPIIHADFGTAFAELIIDDLHSVQDTSVAYALKGVIRNVLKRAED
jgi:hypothetical protein